MPGHVGAAGGGVAEHQRDGRDARRPTAGSGRGRSAPPGMKISFWVGRSAPPDSTSEITGSRFSQRDLVGAAAPCAASTGCSRRRGRSGRWRRSRTRRPRPTPMPVTTLAPTGKSLPQPASGDSSRNGESRVEQQLDALARQQLAAGAVPLDVSGAARRAAWRARRRARRACRASRPVGAPRRRTPGRRRERRTVTAGPPGCPRPASAATHPAPWPAGRTARCAATPSPSRPRTITKLTARRFGSRCRVTGRSAVSGSSSRSRSTVREWASQRQRGRRCGPRRRRWRRRPCRRCARRPPGRAAPGGSRTTGPSGSGAAAAGTDASARAAGTASGECGDLDPAAVRQDRAVRRPAFASTVPAANTPYGEPGARRGGEVEARVAARASSTARREKRRPTAAASWSRATQLQQRAGRLLGRGVRLVGAGQRPRRARQGPRPAELLRCADQRGLGLDVQAGEDERHLVAVAAERGSSPTLSVSAAGLAPDAADPHPVRAVLGRAGRCPAGPSRPARRSGRRRSRTAAAR